MYAGMDVAVCGEVGVDEAVGDEVEGGSRELKAGVGKVVGRCGGCMASTAG